MLVNFDQPEAFGPFAPNRPRSTSNSHEGTATPRSLSRMSFTSSTRLSSINDVETENTSIDSPDDATSNELPKSKEPFVPLLPDDFFSVWDSAKARAAGRQHSASTNGGGNGQAWRENMPGEESESGSDVEDDDDDAGSVIYRPVDGGEGEGDDSFESEDAGGVMETPRPRSGFQ